MTQSFRLVKPDSLSAEEIERFFNRAFGPAKGDFLTQHRAWHYHDSPAQYFVLAEDGTIAAFNALIQSQCLLNNQIHECLWLVDIIVLPEFRGQGLQRLMDDAVRDLGRVRLGFPNEIASKIHRKHGWGVRQEATKLTLPLSMRVSNRVRLSQKITGKIARVVSAIVSPLYSTFFRLRRGNYTPQFTKRLTSPDFEQLVTIYENFQRSITLLTTHRSKDLLEWRYANAPYELQYYTAGELVIITRILEHKQLKTLRIMDIFGAIENVDLLNDAIQTVLRDASHAGVEQIQVITSHEPILQCLRSSGFWMEQSIDFCWYSQDEAMMAEIDATRAHWVFADSDFDAP